MISIMAGFVLGFLLIGTGLEWLLDQMNGKCTVDCPSWRNWVFVVATGAAWVFFARVFYVVWERISPEMAPSATEERIRHLRRGGR
jgi:hypothetical protein